MMKLIVFVFAAIVYTNASHVHLAAPAVVTAQSSQVIARNYNGIVTPAVVPVVPKVFTPFLPTRVYPSYYPHVHHFSPSHFHYPYLGRPVYYY
ncbi:unnamed protein product [Chironomus riparius]|uniref:Uncharacterized protein n=1 Tax=Chironomus riparius TaxID=315576 RepID=A0A9N9RML3_9DIPT|nr:unnamed protein product [Chironomus riparius]